MSWDNLRDAEGERDAKERAERSGKLLTTILTAVVLNGVLLMFTYPFIKDALSKKSSENIRLIKQTAKQSPVIIERETKLSVDVREDMGRSPEALGAQANQAARTRGETAIIKKEQKSLRECMKPNNLVDNDVLACTEGRIEKNW